MIGYFVDYYLLIRINGTKLCLLYLAVYVVENMLQNVTGKRIQELKNGNSD